MSADTKWIVTVESPGRDIGAVADDLKKEGLTISEIMTEVGVISGTAKGASSVKLRKIPGVIDVTKDATIEIGKPDSKITW